MNGFAHHRRWLPCTTACSVLLLLAGCQSAAPPTATAPLPREILPLGLFQTLAGTQSDGSAGASPSQSAGASAGAAPSAASSVADRYPIARLIHNEKLVPSNDRDWVPEHKVLPTAEFGDDDKVTVHNVRNAQWLTAVDCIVERDDRSYDLKDLQTVDFIVVPFENKTIAHTMLSFGFGQGTYLGASAEIRVERGESYNAALGLARQFELTYVLADERDLLPVRVKHRKADVYIYRTTASPQQSQAMFKDVMARVNQLAKTPEFYDTLSNNCTTNIVRHVNALAPNRVPYDARVLLPGYADQLAYQLGLLDNRLPFPELKRRAWANERIVKYESSPDFSARIRQ
jgi:hypothetical protein